MKQIQKEIIEKHAVISGRIYTLKEEYQKKLRIAKDLPGYEIVRVVLEQVLKDLDELVK